MPSSLNGTGVTFNDATTLQTGIIPAGNLASNSVTAVKIADANVTTAKLATNERMTSANVLSATAGASAGAVGTYAALEHVTGGFNLGFNVSIAGSSLRYAGWATDNRGDNVNGSGFGGTAPAGTWRSLGRANAIASEKSATVFLRIS